MLSQFITNAIVFLPLVFGNGQAQVTPVHLTRYDATNVTVYEDGSFTLSANDMVYAGCLPTISYEGGFPEGIIPSACSSDYADNVTLYEDGSGIWHYNDTTEIAACFLPNWGCND